MKSAVKILMEQQRNNAVHTNADTILYVLSL